MSICFLWFLLLLLHYMRIESLDELAPQYTGYEAFKFFMLGKRKFDLRWRVYLISYWLKDLDGVIKCSSDGVKISSNGKGVFIRRKDLYDLTKLQALVGRINA
ncbi:MAG: hypothetical protein N2578_00745 [Bdellovibrionaceae bacterium]|nr:hypothetical protein [Pseudobdellovibrionaceae bacterium]